MTNSRSPFRVGRQARPTKKHRPAIWENMLGTVYAMNDDNEVRYFDFDWDGARAFAGVDEPDRDPRLARFNGNVRYNPDPTLNPRRGRLVLWVRKA